MCGSFRLLRLAASCIEHRGEDGAGTDGPANAQHCFSASRFPRGVDHHVLSGFRSGFVGLPGRPEDRQPSALWDLRRGQARGVRNRSRRHRSTATSSPCDAVERASGRPSPVAICALVPGRSATSRIAPSGAPAALIHIATMMSDAAFKPPSSGRYVRWPVRGTRCGPRSSRWRADCLRQLS